MMNEDISEIEDINFSRWHLEYRNMFNARHGLAMVCEYNYQISENNKEKFLSYAKHLGFHQITMNAVRFKIDPVTNQWTQLDLDDDHYPGLCPHGYIGCEEGHLCTGCAADAKKGCSHIFRQYVGFSETYMYCTLCDEKKKD